MGGMRGIKHYMQRCAVQGTPTTLTKVTGIYQKGGKVTETEKHPFRYHYEDIKPGMSVLTHKRTITDSDIQNFANLTWDVFYAHTDITSLEGSIFEKRAAHGYFLLAAAAGLFVSPAKGPVGANYGLEDCRFIRPIYHNDTIQVRLTCQEKRDRDSRGNEHPAGVVTWLVEIYDEDMELVAFATILTLVQKKCPFFDYTYDNVRDLVYRLKGDEKPKWGILTPQHMIEHLEYFLMVSLGEIESEIYTPEEKIEKYQELLWTYKPMMKDFQHPMLEKGKLEALRHEDLSTAIEAFLEALVRQDAYFKEHPDGEVKNSIFGMLNRYDNYLMNRLHFQHHFEQFGLLEPIA